MARPCVGCGFTVDTNGYLQMAGISSVSYPYAGSPNDLFCDASSGEIWAKPWAVPWGYIDAAVITGGPDFPGSGTTTVASTGISITWSTVSGRKYKVSVSGHVRAVTTPPSATDLVAYVEVRDSAGGRARRDIQLNTTTYAQEFHLMYVETATSTASTTRTLYVGRATGTVAVSTYHENANNRSLVMMVEDIGPA